MDISNILFRGRENTLNIDTAKENSYHFTYNKHEYHIPSVAAQDMFRLWNYIFQQLESSTTLYKHSFEYDGDNIKAVLFLQLSSVNIPSDVVIIDKSLYPELDSLTQDEFGALALHMLESTGIIPSSWELDKSESVFQSFTCKDDPVLQLCFKIPVNKSEDE